MRFELWVGAVCAAGVGLAAVACSSSSEATSDNGDGGENASSSSGKSSSSSGGSSSGSSGDDGGSTSGGVTITPKSLKSGGALLLGVTDDDQAVYVTIGGATSDIEAVPLAGGTPAKVVTNFDIQKDVVVVNGGAVGWWTAIYATTNVGTFNVWSKATGAKTALSTTSAAGIFAASDDGARIAFSTAADANSSDIQVVATANAVAVTQGIYIAGDEINLAAMAGNNPTCGNDLGFVGKKLFDAHCVGTTATATDAHVWVVPDGTTTEVRLDNKGTAANVIQPRWLPDSAGNKLFVVGVAPNNTGRIIDLTSTAAVTSAAVEDGTGAGFLLKDGSAAIYRTATGGLKRTATATVAAKTLVAGAKILLDTSNDQTHVIFATLDPTQDGVDIRSGDTTTENQTAVDIVKTATANPVGFSGSGGFVVYSVAAGMGNTLKSQPVAGGAEKDLAKDISGAGVAPEGDGVILLEMPVMQGQISLYTIRYVNASTGASSAKIADGVPDSGFALHKKQVVYTSVSMTGAGLFVADLP